jgi:sugar phosphate isomerase/epimerase
MTNWPIGLSTGCFHQQNILDCLTTIRTSGFHMIEVCSAPAHLDYRNRAAVEQAAARIHELGMEAYSFHAPFSDQIDIASTDETLRAKALAEILLAAEAAALLRVHYFVIHPGPEFSNEISAEERLARMENVVASLTAVADRCRALGIMCVLENKLPHLLFGNTSDILWILDAIQTTEVGACLDTGHATIAGDIFVLLHKLAGHLRLIHAHDNDGHTDEHRTPGDGVIDWEKLLRELVQARFHGAFILELSSAADMDATMGKARRGRQFLRAIARRIALASGPERTAF